MDYNVEMRAMKCHPAILVVAMLAVVLGFGASGVAQTTKPLVPDTPEGLKLYFSDMLDSAEKEDTKRLLILSQILVMPKSEQWFTKTFGKELGTRLNKDYQEEMKDFAPKLAALFLRLKDPTTLTITVNKVEISDDPHAKAYQTLAIESMVDPTALYSVLITKEGTAAKIELWSLVYDGLTFRMVGKMQGVYESSDSRRNRGSSATRP
jgi:hypothetical protein